MKKRIIVRLMQVYLLLNMWQLAGCATPFYDNKAALNLTVEHIVGENIVKGSKSYEPAEKTYRNSAFKNRKFSSTAIDISSIELHKKDRKIILIGVKEVDLAYPDRDKIKDGIKQLLSEAVLRSLEDVPRFGTAFIQNSEPNRVAESTLQINAVGIDLIPLLGSISCRRYAVGFKLIDNNSKEVVFYYVAKIAGIFDIEQHVNMRNPDCSGNALRVIENKPFELHVLKDPNCVPSEYTNLSLMFVDEFIKQFTSVEAR